MNNSPIAKFYVGQIVSVSHECHPLDSHGRIIEIRLIDRNSQNPWIGYVLDFNGIKYHTIFKDEHLSL